MNTNKIIHVIDLDDRDHQLGVRLPDGEAVVLDMKANRGRLVIYVPAEVAVRPMGGQAPQGDAAPKAEHGVGPAILDLWPRSWPR